MRRLVRLRAVPLDAKARRLGSCYDIADLRRAAKRRIPRPVFDYVDGAADEEIAVAANVAAFRSWRFLPRVLAGVASADTSAPVFGSTLPVPMVLGPTGYTRMLHPDGEIGGARSAARHGLPYTLSTMATTGIEELRAGAAPGRAAATLWFQLYLTRDRAQSYDLVDRAAANGYTALVVTVDTIVAGNRVRDLRNGLSIPPELTLATIASVASKPSYWYRLLSGPALDYANFAGRPRDDGDEDGGLLRRRPELVRHRGTCAPAGRGSCCSRGRWGLPTRGGRMELGLDGVQLSNHGGRQLDRTVAPVDLIAPVREAVGPSFTVLVDSGVRHGADVAIALALGADAAVLGRAYLYGLMVGGEAGVDRALDLLIAAVPVHDAVPRDDVGRGAAQARPRPAHPRGGLSGPGLGGAGLRCRRRSVVLRGAGDRVFLAACHSGPGGIRRLRRTRAIERARGARPSRNRNDFLWRKLFVRIRHGLFT